MGGSTASSSSCSSSPRPVRFAGDWGFEGRVHGHTHEGGSVAGAEGPHPARPLSPSNSLVREEP